MKLLCCICGMEINERNINVNSAAFISANKYEAPEFCQFCGARKEFLVEEAYNAAEEKNNKLDSITTKILDHGVKLELFNSDFYKKAAELAKDIKLKQMFRDLARIEYMHAMIHKNLGGFTETPVLREISYERYDNDESLMQQAVLRETHAVDFYSKYVKTVGDERISKILSVLESVEKDHITLLCN